MSVFVQASRGRESAGVRVPACERSLMFFWPGMNADLCGSAHGTALFSDAQSLMRMGLRIESNLTRFVSALSGVVSSVQCLRQQSGEDFADAQDLCEAEVFPRGSRFGVRFECFENSVSHCCRSQRLCGAGRALPSSS